MPVRSETRLHDGVEIANEYGPSAELALQSHEMSRYSYLAGSCQGVVISKCLFGFS
jgi:hypothetical protein